MGITMKLKMKKGRSLDLENIVHAHRAKENIVLAKEDRKDESVLAKEERKEKARKSMVAAKDLVVANRAKDKLKQAVNKANNMCPECQNVYKTDEVICRKCGVKRKGEHDKSLDAGLQAIVKQEQEKRRQGAEDSIGPEDIVVVAEPLVVNSEKQEGKKGNQKQRIKEKAKRAREKQEGKQAGGKVKSPASLPAPSPRGNSVQHEAEVAKDSKKKVKVKVKVKKDQAAPEVENKSKKDEWD